jgi:hypothetical protein
MQKKVLIFVAILILGGFIYWLLFPKSAAEDTALLQQVCPDAWYRDEMPVIGEKPLQDEYVIINGERWELDQIDIPWVTQMCPVNKPISVF